MDTGLATYGSPLEVTSRYRGWAGSTTVASSEPDGTALGEDDSAKESSSDIVTGVRAGVF